jgi:hypothetical protein
MGGGEGGVLTWTAACAAAAEQVSASEPGQSPAAAQVPAGSPVTAQVPAEQALRPGAEQARCGRAATGGGVSGVAGWVPAKANSGGKVKMAAARIAVKAARETEAN